jgi:hypothetical protein
VKPTVRIAFDLSLAGAGDFFTLDDPVKGVLAGGTVTGTFDLAGDIYADVSDDVRSVSVRRGRPRELQQFTAGQAVVTLDNRDRLYDPTAGTAVSPYGPSILPRKAISVGVNGQVLFTGQVEDWDLQYSLSGDATTTAKGSDGLTLLSAQTIQSGTATPEKSGARVESVLDEVDWPAGRRTIDTGIADLGADAIGENVNALTYLQSIEASEAGFLFIGKDGALTFRERTSSQLTPVLSFSDDGSGLPFSDIELEFGTEFLFTRVSVEYIAGTAASGTAIDSPINTLIGTVTVDDAAQQLNYGVTELTIKTLLDGPDQADDVAQFYLFRYSVPTLRVVSLTVDVEALSPAEATGLFDLELGDGAEVTYTPNKIGDPIVRTVVVDSIEHDISPARHTVRLSFSDNLVGFILDADQLDVDRLGF